jgi:DNA invertase Pin-like site-specific DNA recombinase
MTNNNRDMSSKKEELRRLYGKYRGMRAFLLTRVSTGSQSHDAQERVIRELLIENLDLRLDEDRHVKHDTYTGLEYRYRAVLDEILQMAERQEFDILCLDVLDRGLGRKGVSREVFRGQLRELGIHILTTEPSDHSDDDSLEGQLMRLLKGYKAEEEVNDFVRRSKNGIRHKALGDAEKNIPPQIIGNGIRLYGYKYVLNVQGKKGQLELNHDIIYVDRKGVAWSEVRVIVFIFRCAKRRIPIRAIARRLNEIGIPAPCISIGRKYSSKGVKVEKPLWQPSVVSRKLRDTSYSGKSIVNKYSTVKEPGKKWRRYKKNPPEEHIIVPIPAIVSEGLQNEIIRNLQYNQKFASRNDPDAKLMLLYGGLAKCGYCGRNLRLQRRTNFYKTQLENQREYLAYRCSSKASGTLNQCPGEHCFISLIALEDAVWEVALQIIQDPYMVDKALEAKRSKDPTVKRRKEIKKAIDVLRNEQNNLQRNLSRIMKEDVPDRSTENALLRELRSIEHIIEEYNSELLDDSKIHREWEATQKELERLHKKCAAMREKLKKPGYEPGFKEKRELIEFFGITATVWREGHKPYRKVIQAKFSDIVLQFP